MRDGFTLVELLIALGIVLVLLTIALAAVHRTRRAAASVQCLSNLRQIHTGFMLYAERSGGSYPDPFAAGTSWEGSLQHFLRNSAVFKCPSDEEIAPIMESSYDWRDTADKRTTLAGRAMTDVRRSDAVLAFESLPGWHAKKKMNAVRVSGTGVTMDQREWLEDFTRPIR